MKPEDITVKESANLHAVMNIYASEHNVNVHTGHSTRINRGIKAETDLFRLLRAHGRKCEKQVHQCPFDILVDGWKIDLKTAYPTKASGQQRWHGDRWLFNLHHSGRQIIAADFFILRMLEAPLKPGDVIHLLLRAPHEARSYAVYSGRIAAQIPLAEEFNLFLRGKYRAGPAKSFKLEGLLPEVDDARNRLCIL